LDRLVLIGVGAAAGAELGEVGAGVAVESGRSFPEDPLVPRRCAFAFARASSFSPSCQKNVAARKQSKLMMTHVRVRKCIRHLSTKQPFSEGRNPSAHGSLECGGKRSATPLWLPRTNGCGQSTIAPHSQNAVAAALCRRSPQTPARLGAHVLPARPCAAKGG